MLTPFQQDIKSSYKSWLNLLFNSGASSDTVCQITGRTSLMRALFHGRLEEAASLLERGSSWETQDINGLTALHYAVDSGMVDAVEFALENSASSESFDYQGWTPLIRAVAMQCDMMVIRSLLHYTPWEFIYRHKDDRGLTFLDHAKLAERHDILHGLSYALSPTKNML